MEVRDPVHGLIQIYDVEIPIITNDFFCRLRNIKQLGFSEFIFPGATHSRFLHSLGVMHVGSLAFDKLFPGNNKSKDLTRLRETFRLACLLHDIGHAPLSHSSEMAMPPVKDLKIPKEFFRGDQNQDRQATHEDYTIKSIADSSFSSAFKQVEDKFGVDRKCVADLMTGFARDPGYFTVEGINYFPILHQLVSSELDCDRMDYLLRDSYFCGVSYGTFDLDWLLDNIKKCIIDDTVYLGITERAVLTFEDFLLCRYHMFIMVYFHYRAVCLEQLLCKFFQTSKEEYVIPGNIEEYIEHDDHFLNKILRKSNNPYAKAIVKNQIPEKIFESYNGEQHKKLEIIEKYLKDQDIDFIKGSSEGRISKYYDDGRENYLFPMKVVRIISGRDEAEYSDINQATDLFNKFRKTHSIMRLHCDVPSLKAKEKSDLFDFIAHVNSK
ncbi:MAG: HD domain-containing protein [Epsilonproteobacteria bacterium]|nr:MAG: HD domain-containing protein [Campylobacterota bacterium]RLA66151.1 MAG: HD domain-containing protein [Campylobacterota bacterium]